jgi:hypothetical protein
VLNNAEYFLEALSVERNWTEGFPGKLAEVRYNTFEVGGGVGGHYFGSENLGVEAVAVVDPPPHCEDFASQNQLNNVIYPTVALQGVAGCKLASNCYFPSFLPPSRNARANSEVFFRDACLLYSRKRFLESMRAFIVDELKRI